MVEQRLNWGPRAGQLITEGEPFEQVLTVRVVCVPRDNYLGDKRVPTLPEVQRALQELLNMGMSEGEGDGDGFEIRTATVEGP